MRVKLIRRHRPNWSNPDKWWHREGLQTYALDRGEQTRRIPVF